MKKQIRKQFTLWKPGLRQPSDRSLRLIVSLLALPLLLATGAQAALPEEGRPATIPAWAVEVRPDVWYMGQQLDPQSGEMVDGWIFVDREDDHRIGRSRRGKPPSCYALGGLGPWRTTETWSGNFTNNSGISEADVITTLTAAQTTYETQTGLNIFGALVEAPPGYTPPNPPPGPDGQNYVWFGDTGSNTIVAITYTWGIGQGPPSNRQITEFKILFQDGRLGPYGEPLKIFTVIPEVEIYYFDLENVAAHEFGHAVGLLHPDSSCTEETMYGGVAIGETKKRTLNAGDIAGLDSLY